MTINKQDKFGIIFTVSLVGFVFIIIQMLSTSFQTNDRIIIIIICGIVLAIGSFFAYRNKPRPNNEIYSMNNRSYVLFFIIGVILGLLIHQAIGMAYGINYQKAGPSSIYYGLSLAFGGYAGFYFFIAMSMVVSVIEIPFIRSRLGGDTRWIPCIGGTTFGFGLMIFAELFSKGIPKLWFIF